MWHYLTEEDMEFFKDRVSKVLYCKLSHQCGARIPMLKTPYLKLKKKYE